jgi:hypothetical protein
VILAVVGAAILFLCLALVIAVIRDPGPLPDDVALAYELAWDHLDFASLWTLSGTELHDGLDRDAFIAAKRAAYASRPELGRLAADVTIDDVAASSDDAAVRTRVVLRDGESVNNQIQLAKRGGKWLVVGYRLETDAARPFG